MSDEYCRFHYPIGYEGNILWLVLFLLFWPPLGLLLLFLNACVRRNGLTYSLEYQGNQFWLFFWTLIFFPIAILLSILNGFDVIGKERNYLSQKKR